MTTVSHRVVHVNTESLITRIVLDEDYEPIHALTCHPSQSAVVTGNHGGILEMWDYSSKVRSGRKVFNTEKQIQCVTFDPKGKVRLCLKRKVLPYPQCVKAAVRFCLSHFISKQDYIWLLVLQVELFTY